MFESIILVGPCSDLFPIINSSLNITNLPIIDTELLTINIKFLSPISKKIFIIILKKDAHKIEHLINLADVPTEIIEIDFYDGTVQQLLKLKKRIITENVIVTKGDLITNIDIRTISNDFKRSKSCFLTILNKQNSDLFCQEGSNSIVGFTKSNLLFYETKNNYNFSNELFYNNNIIISDEIDVIQFYMFKKELFDLFTPEIFSFKSNLLPKIVDYLRNSNPVRLFNTMNSNKLEDLKNIIGFNVMYGNVIVVNTIIGKNVTILNRTKILSSIIMDNINIGENCIIDDCVIGSNVIILDNTILRKCIVSPFYIFTKSVNNENTNFTCN
ncbi:translation initiation factor e2b gamma subunit [Vairimorpha apis BRL 01]|uniref:Translation initiation factor eIF2B subunit gamma n=1 Tax=Vairimorpha apis BRL 01 TaxID=1037528 RepID=T0MBP0_9MICR|nr:translation initiation factor e2b gamma subunit [Vairimorpha apis BRL 01]